MPNARPSSGLGRTMLVTHQDLDGFVSAALWMSYLASTGNDQFVGVDFVDFSMKQSYGELWAARYAKDQYHEGAHAKLGGPPDTVIISDFPLTWVPTDVRLYHVDHHTKVIDESLVTPERLEDLRRMLVVRPVEGLRDTKAPSASEIIRRLLADRGWHPSAALAAAIDTASRVDTLDVPSVNEALDVERAPMSYDYAVRKLPMEWLREACTALASGMSLERSLVAPYREFLDDRRMETFDALERARRRLRPLGPHGALLYLVDHHPDKEERLIHYENPKVRYAATISIEPRGYVLGQMAQPGFIEWDIRVNLSYARDQWRTPLPENDQSPNMAQVVRQVSGGGGGHPFAAGNTLTVRGSFTDATQLAEKIIAQLERMALQWGGNHAEERTSAGYQAPQPGNMSRALPAPPPSVLRSDAARHRKTAPVVYRSRNPRPSPQ